MSDNVSQEDNIVKIMKEELIRVYCYNCRHENNYIDEYGNDPCENCHRKFQNWGLKEFTARKMAKKILEIFK